MNICTIAGLVWGKVRTYEKGLAKDIYEHRDCRQYFLQDDMSELASAGKLLNI